MPAPNQLHVDAILSNVSLKYQNEELIGLNVMPIIPVKKRSDLYFVYNIQDTFEVGDDNIGPTGEANEMDWSVSDDNYSVRDHALADYLAQATIDNADDPIQPEVDTVEFLTGRLDLAEETRIAGVVFSAASYEAGNLLALAGNTQWGGGADDPMANIMAAIEGCIPRANTLVMGIATFTVLRKHPQILDAVKAIPGGVWRGGMVSESDLAALFNVKQVLVGRARYNSAKMGQPMNLARVWGGDCAALYVEEKPGIKTITFGGTFSEMLKEVQRDFEPKRGVKGSHYFKVAWNSTNKVMSPRSGYLIENAVSLVM